MRCGAHLGRAACQQQVAHLRDVLRHLLVGPVHLAEQNGRGIDRVARMDEILGGLDGRPVHHLETGRDDARGDDLADGGSGPLDIVEGSEHYLRPLRHREQSHRHLHHYPEHALRSNQQGQQIVTGRVERLAADLDHLAVDQDQLERQDVVHSEPVLEAVHAPRVLGHIAADGASYLRGGIRGIVEPMGGGRLGDRQVAHPRLGACGAVDRVDAQDAVEARKTHHHPVGQGQGAAGEAGPGAASDDRNLPCVAKPQDALNLIDRARQEDEQRQLAIRREPVALVGTHLLFL
jgi:hypothetical protein